MYEYGGGDWLVHDNRLYFVNRSDQDIYVADGQKVTRLTDHDGNNFRFGDGIVDESRGRLIYVYEQHDGLKVSHGLCAVSMTDGSVTLLVSDEAFFMTPTLSPDGNDLFWISWSCSVMPWDHSCLVRASLDSEGMPGEPELLVNEPNVSVQQPSFTPSGVLYYIADRTGWWNVFRLDEPKPMVPAEKEFGLPLWHLGVSTLEMIDDNRAVCIVSSNSVQSVHLIDLGAGTTTELDQPFTHIVSTSVHEHRCTLVGSSSDKDHEVLEIDLETGELKTIIERPSIVSLDVESVVLTDPICYGVYYPPQVKSGKHPLVINVHGGPTESLHTGFDIEIAFWTSQGYGYFDLGYRGSTGYGRAFRDLLIHTWGIVDTEDAIAAAKWAMGHRDADPNRIHVRGGSAGGLTALAAVCSTDIFAAATSYYGIANLATWGEQTHKFEAQYPEVLVGYDYEARSPTSNGSKIKTPVLLLQGLDDRVVPPEQSREMVAALEEYGCTYEYEEFAGEGHGFRRSESRREALNRELAFYQRYQR